MDFSKIEIRPATFEEFSQILNLANDEFEWELCQEDFLVWRRYMTDQCFLVASDSQGKIFGSVISAQVGHGDLGQIGMFYVKAECRSRGIGSILLKKALASLENRNIFLITDLHMVDKYAKNHGFKYVPEWDVLITDGPPKKFSTFLESLEHISGELVEVTPMRRQDLPDVLLYDRSILNGIDRSCWCENFLLAHPTTVAMVARDPRTGSLLGYGTLRRVRRGVLVLESIFAESEHVTRKLIASLLASFDHVTDCTVGMFYRSTDIRMQTIVDDLGLQPLFRAKFMSTKYLLDLKYENVYCLSNFFLAVGY